MDMNVTEMKPNLRINCDNWQPGGISYYAVDGESEATKVKAFLNREKACYESLGFNALSTTSPGRNYFLTGRKWLKLSANIQSHT